MSAETSQRRPPADGPGDDLAWIALQAETLYRHDTDGRLLANAEPNGADAPHFFLGRTRLGNLWRLRADLDPACVRELARLAAREPPLRDGWPDGPPPPERWEPIRRVLREAGIAEPREWRGPAYRFPASLPGASGEGAVELDPQRAECLEPHFPDLVDELPNRRPAVAVLDSGAAVAVCFVARRAERPGPLSVEAGVETRSGWRGRGLGARVVAGWARCVRARGGIPLYSTSWDNRASRALARRLGLEPYGEDGHLS